MRTITQFAKDINASLQYFLRKVVVTAQAASFCTPNTSFSILSSKRGNSSVKHSLNLTLVSCGDV